ncbi:hypothetical protein E2C01_059239 [Portunus trituberculatus]|uniref:Uncharacterized protein n=1 Tax=Portunus trituberculatus TaxID=210409 RepID=A0A5B7GXH9_PORTR|nr:hypothetical protein [Portunus trituberculatus]
MPPTKGSPAKSPTTSSPATLLGSAGFVASSSSLPAQHASGFSESLLRCLPGLLSFITSLMH